MASRIQKHIIVFREAKKLISVRIVDSFFFIYFEENKFVKIKMKKVEY